MRAFSLVVPLGLLFIPLSALGLSFQCQLDSVLQLTHPNTEESSVETHNQMASLDHAATDYYSTAFLSEFDLTHIYIETIKLDLSNQDHFKNGSLFFIHGKDLQISSDLPEEHKKLLKSLHFEIRRTYSGGKLHFLFYAFLQKDDPKLKYFKRKQFTPNTRLFTFAIERLQNIFDVANFQGDIDLSMKGLHAKLHYQSRCFAVFD